MAVSIVVQSGDTLSEIAAALGVSVDDIARANGISDPNVIFAGQRLSVPVGAPGAGTIAVWTVQPGDTLWEIGQRFGLSADQIARHNSIDDPNLIFAGQQLRIPNPSIIGP
jgi:spore germination protein